MSIPIAIWSALIAALVTAILGVSGYFYRQWEQKRRAYKQLLYNLLVIWDQVATIHYADVDATMDVVFSRVGEQFPDTQQSLPELKKNPAFRDILSQTIAFAANRKRPESLNEKYAISLQEVSKYDPMIAWKLADKEYIDDLLTKANTSPSTFVEQVFGSMSFTDPQDESFTKTLDSIISDDAMNRFEDQILMVAEEAGERSATEKKMVEIKNKRSAKVKPEGLSNMFEELKMERL